MLVAGELFERPARLSYGKGEAGGRTARTGSKDHFWGYATSAHEIFRRLTAPRGKRPRTVRMWKETRADPDPRQERLGST